jgi:hypothetical protein
MSTILGQHISLIRPIPPHRCIVYKDERPRVKALVRTKKCTCSKVKLVCVEVLGGIIYSITKGTHLKVLETYNINPERVIRTGWQLDNNQFMWR